MTGKIGSFAGAVTFLAMVYSCNGAEILWDVSHGEIEPGEAPCLLSHLPLLTIFEEEGISLVKSEEGVLNEDLSRYDALVLAFACSFDSPYTSEEASLIEAFVADGGGLLILGDHPILGNVENLHPVTQRFGVMFTVVGPASPLVPVIEHPIFQGVSQIKFGSPAGLTVQPPSVVAAVGTSGFRVGIAVAEVGKGRVVISGDESVFEHIPPEFFCCLFRLDNEIFFRNIFRWFLRLNCTNFDALNGTIAQAEFDNRGIQKSLESKANNARRQFDRGNLRGSGNILCAFIHEVDAQDGKHIEPSSAQTLRNCVQSLAVALEIPLPCLSEGEKVTLVLENFPNPFRSTTTIHYILPTVSNQQPAISGQKKIPVKLTVYDITGRLVKTLINENLESRVSRVQWNGKNEKGMEVPSGIYLYRLTSGDFISTKKLILLR